MAGDEILLERKGNVAVVRLNIPHKLNALTLQLYSRFAAALYEADEFPDTVATVVTGTGKFFSSGADVASPRTFDGEGDTPRMQILGRLSTGNMELARAMYNHKKVLIAALNGPAVGLSAALLGWFDLIFAVESAWIMTPFSTLSLAAEGGASLTFPKRMGLSKANEALLIGRRLPVKELKEVGFVTGIYPDEPDSKFLARLLKDLDERFDDLDPQSLQITKGLIQSSYFTLADKANVDEIFAGVERLGTGRPVEQFARLARKEKRHKL